MCLGIRGGMRFGVEEEGVLFEANNPLKDQLEDQLSSFTFLLVDPSSSKVFPHGLKKCGPRARRLTFLSVCLPGCSNPCGRTGVCGEGCFRGSNAVCGVQVRVWRPGDYGLER